MKHLLWALLLLVAQVTFAQSTTLKALFIGNSYTAGNNMSGMVASLAESKGDSLILGVHTQGGATLQQHSTNATVTSKINQDNWDFVVLQEQSQLPSFSPGQVSTAVLPYAAALNNTIVANDSCTETLFFMTWGRKNGDASNCQFYPPVCTYDGMQQRLRESYLLMANNNDAAVAPVGMAWQTVRQQYPNIELYTGDESHPNANGSYLAACVFYVSMFKKPITGSTYWSSLDSTTATALQQIASDRVLDSLSVWRLDTPVLTADFQTQVQSDTVDFTNNSTSGTSWFWDFGDGNTSTDENPQHVYGQSGTFTVTLTINDGCFSATFTQDVVIDISNWMPGTGLSSMAENLNDFRVFPNPASDRLELMLESGWQSNMQVQLVDVSGRVVLQRKVSNESGSTLLWNVTAVQPGAYLILVEADGKQLVSRVLIR